MADLELIRAVNVTSDTTEVSITGIPNTYRDLLLQAEFIQGSSITGIGIRINNLSTSIYSGSLLTETASSLSHANVGSSSANVGSSLVFVRGNSAQLQAWILDYAQSKRHNILIRAGSGVFNGGQTLSGWRVDTITSINSIQIRSESSNSIGTGSKIYLYGVKA